MALPTLTPTKPELPPTQEHTGPPPRNGKGHDRTGGGNNHDHGDDGPEQPSRPEPLPAKKPRSPWPFLLDVGWVMALFGLIIFGVRSPLIVIGAVIAVVALIGWVRDARAEFRRLSD